MSERVTYDTPMGSCICGCGGGACIPQRKYGTFRTHEKQTMVLFSVNGKCGVPLTDALNEHHVGLDRRDDNIYFRATITIRLEVRPSPSMIQS